MDSPREGIVGMISYLIVDSLGTPDIIPIHYNIIVIVWLKYILQFISCAFTGVNKTSIIMLLYFTLYSYPLVRRKLGMLGAARKP